MPADDFLRAALEDGCHNGRGRSRLAVLLDKVTRNDAPEWSLRVSLANLPDEVYDDIGRGVRTIARGYRDAYDAATGSI